VQTRRLPNPERLSILTSIILLAYATTRFVEIPSQEYAIQLPGLLLSFRLNINTLTSVLVAALTATGADWLMRDHPARQEKTTIQQWILPSLSALILGVPLNVLPLGVYWWVAFLVGGLALVAVLVAEYIAIDPDDTRRPGAVAGLIALSFALFFILTYTLRYGQARLLFSLPTLTLTGGLVCLRTLHLRQTNRWEIAPSLVVALIAGQVIAALHYYPASPLSYALVIFGLVYSLTSLMENLIEKQDVPQSFIEPGIVLGIVWGLAFLIW
jgi:hypothetical protein